MDIPRLWILFAAMLLALFATVSTSQEVIDGRGLDRRALTRPPEHGGFASFAFHPDEKTIVGGVGVLEEVGGEILIRDAKSGKIKKQLGKHTATPTWVAFTDKGESVLSFSSDDATLHLWSASGNKPKATLTLGGAMHPQRPPKPSADESFLVHAVQLPQTARHPGSAIVGALEVWDLNKQSLRWKRDRSYARALAVSPDDKSIAIWVDEVTWREEDLPGGKLVRTFLALLDASNGETLWEVPTKRLDLLHLLFARQGTEIIGTSYGGLLRFAAAGGSMLEVTVDLSKPEGRSFPIHVYLSPHESTLILERSMGAALDLYDLESGDHVERYDFSGLDGLTETALSPGCKKLVGKLGSYPHVIDFGKHLLR